MLVKLDIMIGQLDPETRVLCHRVFATSAFESATGSITWQALNIMYALPVKDLRCFYHCLIAVCLEAGSNSFDIGRRHADTLRLHVCAR
jgi:hypothetical protein